jgi:hypothetical protein
MAVEKGIQLGRHKKRNIKVIMGSSPDRPSGTRIRLLPMIVLRKYQKDFDKCTKDPAGHCLGCVMMIFVAIIKDILINVRKGHRAKL